MSAPLSAVSRTPASATRRRSFLIAFRLREVRLARNSSGVSLDSFVNKVTFQELTREGLKDLAPALETLAEVESLEGHARAVRYRLGREEEVEG